MTLTKADLLAVTECLGFSKDLRVNTRIPLTCADCGHVVAFVHPPKPAVPMTCSTCRDAA